MADNRDIAKIKHLLIDGRVGGGDDKQMVCEQIKKFRLAKDQSGMDKYILNLEIDRAKKSSNGEMVKNLTDLTKIVLELKQKIEALEADKSATSNIHKNGGK